jgi:hypothetical protein
MRKTNDTSRALDKLGETELEHVVGGTPATKTSAKGSDPQAYMTITMTDVFIAPYH